MKNKLSANSKAELKFQKVMHEFGKGKLRSHDQKVRDQKQAVAIAFSEARKVNPNYGMKKEGGSTSSIFKKGDRVVNLAASKVGRKNIDIRDIKRGTVIGSKTSSTGLNYIVVSDGESEKNAHYWDADDTSSESLWPRSEAAKDKTYIPVDSDNVKISYRSGHSESFIESVQTLDGTIVYKSLTGINNISPEDMDKLEQKYRHIIRKNNYSDTDIYGSFTVKNGKIINEREDPSYSEGGPIDIPRLSEKSTWSDVKKYLIWLRTSPYQYHIDDDPFDIDTFTPEVQKILSKNSDIMWRFSEDDGRGTKLWEVYNPLNEMADGGTAGQGDVVKWKKKEGDYVVGAIYKGIATITKIGHLSDPEYKGSYNANLKDLTIIQKETRKFKPMSKKYESGADIYFPFIKKESYSVGDVVIHKDTYGEYSIKDTIKGTQEQDGVTLYLLQDAIGAYAASELRPTKLVEGGEAYKKEMARSTERLLNNWLKEIKAAIKEKKTWELYDKYEDNNYHSENVILITQTVGSEKDKQEAIDLWKAHTAAGSLPDDVYEKRYALQKRVWPAFVQNAKTNEGVMGEGGPATPGRPKPFAFKEGDQVRVVNIITSLNPEKKGQSGVITRAVGKRAYVVKFADDTASTFRSDEIELNPGEMKKGGPAGIAQRGLFDIGSIEDKSFKGYTFGEEWNGFAVPYFESEEANAIGHELGGKKGYDKPPYFSFPEEGPGTPLTDGPYKQQKIQTVDGEKLVFPIGAYTWTWSDASAANGGELQKIYDKGTAQQLWDAWDKKERTHFLIDHSGQFFELMGDDYNKSATAFTTLTYDTLPSPIRKELVIHHAMGLYKEGGPMAEGGKIKAGDKVEFNEYENGEFRKYTGIVTRIWNDEEVNVKWDYDGNIRTHNPSGLKKISMGGSMAEGGILNPRKRYTEQQLKDMGFSKTTGEKKNRYYFEKDKQKYEFQRIPSIGMDSDNAADIFKPIMAEGGPLPASKQKLQDRINTLKEAKANAGAGAQKSIQKKIDKLQAQIDYNPTSKERAEANKGRFAMDVPAKYSKAIYKKLWSIKVFPRIHKLNGTASIVVNSQTNLNKAYTVYSDISKEKVPSLAKISRKL